MKKIISLILIVLILVSTICGCESNENQGKLKIVTTYFSAYDWVKNILGDKYSDTELILISDNGVDIHSYQPTADDIINIKTADIVITIGSSSDEWVSESLKKDSESIKIINSLSVKDNQIISYY